MKATFFETNSRADFKKLIKDNEDTLYIVIAIAEWCTFCPEALKLLHDQNVLNEDEVQIIILTEEENKDVITYLKLMGYPTMISFYEGTQQYFFSGVEEKQFNRFLELNKKLLQ